MRTRIAAAVVFAFGVAAGEARAEEPPEAPPLLAPPAAFEEGSAVFAALAVPARTPKEALVKLDLAARTGDPRRAVPLFAEPFGSALRKTFEAGTLLLEATRRLQSAVVSRLGPDASRALALEKRLRHGGSATPVDGAIEVVSIEEKAGGATAVVRAKSNGNRGKEETIELVREGGEWKLLPPKHHGRPFGRDELKQLEDLATGLENAAAAIVRLAADVEAERVRTVPLCRERIEAVDLEVMKAMMGFGPRTHDEED